MKRLFTAALFAGTLLGGVAHASDALYTHCVAHWSATTFGETLCGVAIRDGYPATAPGEERSCARAYQLGQHYYPWLTQERNLSAAVLCALFATQGPQLFSEW